MCNSFIIYLLNSPSNLRKVDSKIANNSNICRIFRGDAIMCIEREKVRKKVAKWNREVNKWEMRMGEVRREAV